MKFGLEYDRHILPQWSEHYIDYNGLRMQLRAKVQRQESIDGLTRELEVEAVRFRQFLLKNFDTLDVKSDALVKLQSEESPSGAVPGGTAPTSPIPFSQARAIVALTDGFLAIKRFSNLNMTAIRRLLDKFAASGQAAADTLYQLESELEACVEARRKISERLAYNRHQLNKVRARGSEPEVPPYEGCILETFSDGGEEFYPPRNEVARFFEHPSFHIFQSCLVDALNKHSDSTSNPDQAQFLGRLLHLTASHNWPRLDGEPCESSDRLNLVLEKGPDLSVCSVRGETALYCAAQAGSLPNVHAVARYYLQSGESLDTAVPRTGWTPLMVACIKGYTDITKFLLSAGADAQKVDILGWTAREHAAYRGHLTTAALEGFVMAGKPTGGMVQRVNAPVQIMHNTLNSREQAVVVTLGSVQGGHNRATLKLKRYLTEDEDRDLDSRCLEIIIDGADCSSKIVQLPLWQDTSIEPLVGRLGLNMPARVTVRLWDRDTIPALGDKATLGRLESSGTVVLGEDSAKFGKSRESMLRETSVVMLNKETMEFSGTVLLSYVIANPFDGLKDSKAASYKRQSGDPVRLVGHRGLGQNTTDKSNLQIGENTVTSFLSAYRLGAPFVEFDVQLTRDHEAVIYHDFSFSGTGSDVPIHDISLAQYKYAGDIQNPIGALLLDETTGNAQRRPRASSSGEHSVLKARQAQERMRYTVDYDGKGFKANIRGHSIQDAHATLEELLATLPEEIGFNIEMKYQRLHEAVEAGVASVTIDINTFVDVALEKIKKLAGRRPIILSSFTPEVCILLKLKQSAYPVLLITNAGKLPMFDKELRAASLKMGMQFAKRWQLSGLVLACDTFLLCPRLISFVRNAGLVCASYGLGNNDPENAKIQADAGIDILIVDKVKLIAEALSKHQSAEA